MIEPSQTSTEPIGTPPSARPARASSTAAVKNGSDGILVSSSYTIDSTVMSHSGADKLGIANALPIRLVMLATALAIALIASLGWYVWNSAQVFRQVEDRTFRLLELTGEFAYLNEAVQSSARLHVSTNDAGWLNRYEKVLARRNAALAEFRSMAPEVYEEPAAIELRDAYQHLLAIETQAFSLAAHDHAAMAG